MYLQKYLTENLENLSNLGKGELHYQIGLAILQKNLPLAQKYAESYYYFDKQLEFVLPLYYAQKIADENIKHLRDGCFYIGEIFSAWSLKDAAWSYFEKATIINDKDASSYIKLAESFLQLDIHLFSYERKQDITTRTMLVLEKGRKLYPDDVWLKAIHGKILGTRLHGEGEKGIKLIEEAIESKQNSYWMYMMIADIYKQLENIFPDKKIVYCQKRYDTYLNAERFIGGEDPTWGYLGSVECSEILGKPIDKHVEQLLSLINTGRLPEYLKQQVYEKKLFLLKRNKNLDEMDKIYDQLANISGVNAEIFYVFAQFCTDNNNIKMAKKHYEKYLQKIGDIEKINSTIDFLRNE